MTYSLINKCAKNYYNRTFIVQVIAKNVVTCFFLRHSVQSNGGIFLVSLFVISAVDLDLKLYNLAHVVCAYNVQEI